MKKRYFTIFLFTFLLFRGYESLSQIVDTTGTTIKGSKIWINNGTTLYLNGSLYNISTTSPYAATTKGQINNNDTIYSAGNIINGIKGHPLFLFGGTVSLRYDFPQYFSKDTLNFHNLVINKTLNNLILQRNISVANRFELIKGKADILSSSIDLLNNGSIIGETFQNYIFSNEGWIIARNRLLNPSYSGDIGTLKLELYPASDNLGLTTIYRRSKIQDSLVKGSIQRMYDIFPSNTGGSDVVFNYYDSEWQSLPNNPIEGNFKLFKSIDTRVQQSKLVSWSVLTESGVNINTNKVNSADLNIPNATGLRVTVADNNCEANFSFALPTEPVWFCNGNQVVLNAGAGAQKYKWTNGASTQTLTLTAANITGIKDTLGVFVFNSFGCFSYKEVEVNVFPKPVANFTTTSSVCAGFQASYVNASTISLPHDLSYLWKFIDNTTSTSINTTKTYATDGNFSTKLVVTSVYGCKDSVSKSLIIQPKPLADFSLSHTERCSGDIINLTNNSTISTGAIGQSIWTFGDGFTSVLTGGGALNGELKAYSAPGNYQIKLRVRSSGNCLDSITKSVRIHPLPTANFNATNFITNSPTSFSNTSSIVSGYSLSYAWIFGDGVGTSTDNTPIYTYSISAAYSVSLQAQSNKGCISNKISVFTVTSMPIASFSVSGLDVCANVPLSFINNSTVDAGGLAHAWNFGDGTTSTVTNPNKTFANAGNYTISLQVTSGSNLTASFSKLVVIRPIPKAQFSVSDVCLGAANSFINASNISSGNFSSNWQMADGFTTTLLSPIHLFSTTGAYLVKLKTTSDNGCVDSTQSTVTVNPNPKAEFAFNEACKGDATGFVNNSTIASGNFSSIWNLGNASTSSQTNPVLTYANAGNYNVQLNVNSDKGCTSSITKTVVVNEVPIPNFSASIACQGDNTNFTNLSSINSGTMNFAWNFSVATSTLTSPIISFPLANTYNIVLTATSDKGCAKSIAKNVDVKPLPKTDFSFSNNCVSNLSAFTNNTSILAIPSESALTYQWNFGNGTNSTNANPTVNFANAGNYNVTLTATSFFGCVNDTSKTITIHPNPSVSFSLADGCANENIAIANNSTVVGGTISYLWNFNDGSSSTAAIPTKAFIVAKNHQVDLTATSDKGCSVSNSNYVTVRPTPNLNFTHDAQVCLGNALAISDFSTIGSGSFSRNWQFGNGQISSLTNPTVTYTNAGVYVITLSGNSSFGCSKILTSLVTINSAPISDFTIAPSGSLGLAFTNTTQTNGISGISYVWNFGNGKSSTQTSPTEIYSFTGTYSISLTALSPNGCNSNIVKSAKVPYDNIADFQILDGVCVGSVFNFKDQSVFSESNVSYVWNFGDGTISNLKNPSHRYSNDGNYNIRLTVTAPSGATATKNLALNVYPNPNVNFIVPNACQGSLVNLTNSSTDKINHSFKWYLGDGTTATSENVSKTYFNSGNYTITLQSTSPNGCIATSTKTLSVNTVPAFSFGDTIFTCGASYLLNAENTGSSYLWSTNANSQSISVNNAASYSVSVTNAQSCQASKTVFVKLNTPAKLNLGVDATVCSQFEIKGNQPANYFWSTGATSATISVNSSGAYWAEMTDQNGCMDRDTINLTVLISPIANLGADLVKCSNELTQVDALNAGSVFAWSNGENSQKIEIAETGKYIVTVTSSNNCTATDEVNVTINTAPKVKLGADKQICTNDFPLVLSVSDVSNAYLWSNSATANSIMVTGAGQYFVTATAANACVAKDTIQIDENLIPQINLGTVTSFCFGQSVSLNAGNVGASFAWSDGSISQFNTISIAGNYFVKVTNAQNCGNTASISLIQNALPILDLPSTINRCENLLPFAINAPNGYSQYLWNSGASTQSINASITGIYSLSATDNNGCVGTAAVDFKVNAAPIVNLGNDQSFCEGQTLVLDANSTNSIVGASFLWSDATTSRIKVISTTGTLSVDVTNAQGCKSSDEIFVQTRSLPSVDLGIDRTLCVGASSNLNAQNIGSTYLWSTGQTTQTISANNNGLYIVTVTNIYNCKATDNVVVNVINLPGKSLPEDATSCNPIELNAGNPNAAYLWSTGANTQKISAGNTGLYIVNITNGNNCLTRDSINITINPKPIVNLGRDTTICQFQKLTIDANNPGATYFWPNLNVLSRTISVTNPGVYSVLVTNQFQCSTTDSIKVLQNPVPAFNLGADRNICVGNTVTLSTSLPVNTSFLWSSGSIANTFTTSITGNYWLKASFNTGCSFSDTVKVDARPFPIVKLGNDSTVCGRITLDAKNIGSSFVWSNNVITQTNTLTQSGNYSVRVTSPFGCAAIDTIGITVKTAPIVNLGPDLGVCSGEKISLFANTNAEKYKWNTGDTTANLNIDSPGTYILEAFNSNGCKASDQILVTFYSKPVIDLKPEYPLCGDNAVELDAKNTSSNFFWSSTNGFTSSQQKVAITKEGTYYLSVLNGLSCETRDTVKINKTDFSVVAEFLAVSSVRAGDTVKLINLSFPAPFTSTWDFGDGLISKETDPLHIYYISGNIDVQLAVTNGICTDVKKKTLVLSQRRELIQDSVKKQSAFLGSKLYPNPNDGRFIMEISLSEIRKMSLEFYDLSGTMIYSTVLEPNDLFHKVFDFPDLPSGMYLLRASLKDEFKLFKVIISK